MKQIDFYKEGTTLLYVKRDNHESSWRNTLTVIIILIFWGFVLRQFPKTWITDTLFFGVAGFLFLWIIAIDFTEKNRPQSSKYFLYLINNKLFYERITPEKEGFNKDNGLINFKIVKFIDEKRSEVKIISNNKLPWEKRKVYISKEYLPHKKEVIEFLNRNYTIDDDIDFFE